MEQLIFKRNDTIQFRVDLTNNLGEDLNTPSRFIKSMIVNKYGKKVCDIIIHYDITNKCYLCECLPISACGLYYCDFQIEQNDTIISSETFEILIKEDITQ